MCLVARRPASGGLLFEVDPAPFRIAVERAQIQSEQTLEAVGATEAGIFNLSRTIGSSVGISIAARMLARSTQVHWNQLGGFVQPYNPAVTAWLQASGMTLADPQAAAMLAGELSRRASMMAFVDTFRLIGWSFVLLAPLLLLISARRDTGPERGSME